MQDIQSKGNYINGTWVSGEGATLLSLTPFSNAPIWQGKCATEAQINTAYQAARTAFKFWAMTDLEERLSYVQKYAEILEDRKEELASLLASEAGKILWEARTEIAAMIGKVGLSIKSYHERTGTTENTMPGARAILRHRPHGVMAVYGPYNFPGHLPNGHIVPALIAGNTVIFKPSEQTPAFAEAMVECWIEAGLPAGVLNLVQGEKDTGIALSSHPELDGLLFTGSSATGRILHKQFAGHPEKLLALELGGNNPTIIADAEDTDAVAWNIIQSAFITTGQRCTCTRRLILVGDADQHLPYLIAKTKKLVQGKKATDESAFYGPLIDNQAANNVMAAQQHLSDIGAECLLEAQRENPTLPFVTPAIWDVTNVRDLIPDEEIFGPLLKIYRAKNLEEAIEIANDTKYGLSAGILTDREDIYQSYLLKSRAGILNWNKPTTGASGAAPFGGVGCSGNHRPSAWYAADYCSYPVASVEASELVTPSSSPAGMGWD